MGDFCKHCLREDPETPWREWECLLGPRGDDSNENDLQRNDRVTFFMFQPSLTHSHLIALAFGICFMLLEITKKRRLAFL